MTPESVLASVRSLTTALADAGAVLDYNMPVRIGTREETLITWAGSTTSPVVAFASGLPSFSLKEYVDLVQQRQYSFLLADGSIFQLCWTFSREQLIKHRLLYVPAPLVFDQDDVAELGLLDTLDMIFPVSQQAHLLMVTPVRFDFDSAAASGNHPASHLTIIKHCCRVPVFGPLSLGHFCRFIFRSFYPDSWARLAAVEALSAEWGNRTILPEHEHEFHVAQLRRT